MESTYNTTEAAKYLGFKVKTLQNCELVILNDEKMSPEQEMIEDLMTIIHCFSSRLYGLRNYRKSLKEALNNGKTSQSIQS